MIAKILGIFKTKPDPQKYKTPYDVPKEEHCENCIYDRSTCDRISCFTGMYEKLRGD